MHVPEHPRKKIKTFSERKIDAKKKIKGSDAWFYAINLAKFISTKHEECKIEDTFLNLINCIVDIIQISYQMTSQ